jgi:hypothetical protein
MFPSPKKVSFRTLLTEDIHNTIYTLAHSDIDFASPSPSTLEPLPSGHGHYVSQQQKHKRAAAAAAAALPIRTPTSPACGDKRDTSSEDDSDSDICPSTPITRKNKKPREWVWTLGPINQITPPPSSSPIDDQSLSWHSAKEDVKYNNKPSRPSYESSAKKHAFWKLHQRWGSMAFLTSSILFDAVHVPIFLF